MIPSLILSLCALVGTSYMIEQDVRTPEGRKHVLETTKIGIATTYVKTLEIAKELCVKAQEIADEIKAQNVKIAEEADTVIEKSQEIEPKE